MIKKANGIWIMLAVATFAIPLFHADATEAGVQFSFAYTSAPADIRVWLERNDRYEGYDGRYRDYLDGDHDGDVYDSVTDVALYVRASRSCYATVYVVDTDGYIHIVHPLSPVDNGYLMGNRVYKIYLSEMGFGAAFGAGIAYAYAVCSPAPLDYGHYGIDVFGARCGFRIYGDPYVAARFFYFDLVGGRCDHRLIGVSYARFYIGGYVRYPRYLCAGWHDHYGVRTWCRGDCAVYRDYAVHARDPYSVLNPVRELRPQVARYTHVSKAEPRDPGARLKDSSQKSYPGSLDKRTFGDRRNADALRPFGNDKKTIVKSSRESFVRGKRDLEELRREWERRNGKERRQEPPAAHDTKVHKAVSVGGSTSRSGGTKTKASDSSKSRGVKSSTDRKASSKGESSKARGK